MGSSLGHPCAPPRAVVGLVLGFSLSRRASQGRRLAVRAGCERLRGRQLTTARDEQEARDPYAVRVFDLPPREPFYHRPSARDDAHGMGQASRFLTEGVKGLFTITGSTDTQRDQSIAPLPQARIEVSVDALFG